MPFSELGPLVDQAFYRREDLVHQLKAEDTNTYRLFHGVNEGCPGLTIDRYGSQVLVQTFRDAIEETDWRTIQRYIPKGLGFEPTFDYLDRRPKDQKKAEPSSLPQQNVPEDSPESTSRELGARYVTKQGHRGQDPLLFLDLRAARRFVMRYSTGLSVLNLFAYSCGVSVCAGLGGAETVWSVDFARSALEVGQRNLALNDLPDEKNLLIHSDFFPAIRQIAGLPVTGRGRKRSYPRLETRQFDLVFLDPPRWAKSPFGTVDLVRDYQSVFKPAWLSVSPGGKLICTNHVPKVNLVDWLDVLRRCADKAGRPVKSIDVIQPEADFPSPDGNHPLKIAVVQQ